MLKIIVSVTHLIGLIRLNHVKIQLVLWVFCVLYSSGTLHILNALWDDHGMKVGCTAHRCPDCHLSVVWCNVCCVCVTGMGYWWWGGAGLCLNKAAWAS